MNKTERELANRLLYLPLDIHEKVLLWLAFRGLKPVSEITVLRRKRSHLRRLLRDPEYRKSYKSSYSFNSRNSKRIRKWTHDAGMYIATEGISWHVGKNKKDVTLSRNILHKFDYENEIKSGELFGFPPDSVKAYIENKNKSQEEIDKLMVGTGELLALDPYLKNKYFSPYIFYNIPKNRVIQDSKIAQNWADTIRKDIPRLANLFENKHKITH